MAATEKIVLGCSPRGELECRPTGEGWRKAGYDTYAYRAGNTEKIERIVRAVRGCGFCLSFGRTFCWHNPHPRLQIGRYHHTIQAQFEGLMANFAAKKLVFRFGNLVLSHR